MTAVWTLLRVCLMVEGRKSLWLRWEEKDINREKGAGREDQRAASSCVHLLLLTFKVRRWARRLSGAQQALHANHPHLQPWQWQAWSCQFGDKPADALLWSYGASHIKSRHLTITLVPFSLSLPYPNTTPLRSSLVLCWSEESKEALTGFILRRGGLQLAAYVN